MVFWRLYREARRPGLDGIGGLYAAGRWHELGSRVVYFGASPAIVVLEKLAHLDPNVLPADLLLARFEGDMSAEELIPGEIDDLQDLKQTRSRGDAFLKQRTACVLCVPSIIVPEEYNLIFNPLHPDAQQLKLLNNRRFTFDRRLDP